MGSTILIENKKVNSQAEQDFLNLINSNRDEIEHTLLSFYRFLPNMLNSDFANLMNLIFDRYIPYDFFCTFSSGVFRNIIENQFNINETGFENIKVGNKWRLIDNNKEISYKVFDLLHEVVLTLIINLRLYSRTKNIILFYNICWQTRKSIGIIKNKQRLIRYERKWKKKNNSDYLINEQEVDKSTIDKITSYLYYILADTYFEKKNYRKAIRYYRKGYKISSDNSIGYMCYEKQINASIIYNTNRIYRKQQDDNIPLYEKEAYKKLYNTPRN